MMVTKDKDKTALQAKFDAQKLAFAPIAFQTALALRDLGILEVIQKNRRKGISVEAIAEQVNISTYGVHVLLDFGVDIELVEEREGLWYITKTGHFILHDQLTRVNMDFTQDVCYEAAFYLKDAIKEGKPSGLKVFGKWATVYEALSQLPPKAQKSWFAFDHYYSDTAFPEVLPKVFKYKPKLLLDVGGNTGKWSLQCVRHDEDVKVTILDLPGQLAKAKENIEEQGFSERISGFPINLLSSEKEFPKGADAIWMSQFLVCFSLEEITAILKKAARAMDENCNLFILDTYWDRQRFPASKYSLNATSLYFTYLANGNSRVYHSKDLIQCLHDAGLYVEEDIDEIGVSHTLFRCKKRR